MSALSELDLAGLRDALRARSLSARELAEEAIAAMVAARPLNAFITETPEIALARADAADAALKAGDGGALAGIPIAMKDLFCTEGVRTTAASRILDDFVPPYEATVSANLIRAGAVMVGKANLDEFAMGSSNENSHFGPVLNPWRGADGVPLAPGGSSGGSAAAVAARIVPGATGTDTGGSIRQPAALCGITGLKPTYGRCSRWGIVAFASSLDQAGPFARTVRDAAILLGGMAGFDPKDSTSVDRPVPDYESTLEAGVKGLRIGVPREYRLDGTPPAIQKLWDMGIVWLREQGAEIHEISLPHTRFALAAYYIVAPAEASSNLARYDGVRYGLRVPGRDLTELYENTRAEGFGAEVKRRIMIGTYVLSAGYYDAYYRKAQQVRSRILEDFTTAWQQVDAVLTPTAPSAAFPLGAKVDDPIAMYLNDVFTVPASMAGLPAISVPAGLDGAGLPLGLQVIGRPFDEEMVLRVGRALERAANFTARPDPWWTA